MSDLLRTSAAWLRGQMKQHVSQAVTYRRGDASIEELKATLGRTDLQGTDEAGFVTEWLSIDFLITAEDLDFGDGPVEPEAGDQIDFDARTYEVLPEPSGRCFRFCQAHRISIRIHTKLIDD